MPSPDLLTIKDTQDVITLTCPPGEDTPGWIYEYKHTAEGWMTRRGLDANSLCDWRLIDKDDDYLVEQYNRRRTQAEGE